MLGLSRKPDKQTMLATVESALQGKARQTWDAIDREHRDSWLAWCRDSYSAKERGYRLGTLTEAAERGDLSYVRARSGSVGPYGGTGL